MLGGVDHRTIDATLSRLERDAFPPHLTDFSVCSVIEMAGREKRTRWYSLQGYHASCDRLGIPGSERSKSILDPVRAGGFAPLETSGFYYDAEDFERWAQAQDITIKQMNLIGKARARTKRPNSPVEGSPPSGKRRKQDAPKRPRGRPRKYPPGTTSAQRRYLRKREQAAKGVPAAGKRKRRDSEEYTTDEEDEEDGQADPGSPSPEVDDQPPPPPRKKRGRPPKPKPELNDLPPPVPKKRGRPPKPKPEPVDTPSVPKKRGRPPKKKPVPMPSPSASEGEMDDEIESDRKSLDESAVERSLIPGSPSTNPDGLTSVDPAATISDPHRQIDHESAVGSSVTPFTPSGSQLPEAGTSAPGSDREAIRQALKDKTRE
jgi:hypothetical protein